MKSILIFLSIFSATFAAASPGDTAQLYNPSANAQKDIAAAVAKAKSEKKFVMLVAGGNWCSWCKLFNKTVTGDKQLDSVISENFIVYHLNYSDENKNE